MLLADCELTSAQFQRIAGLLYDHAGIRMRPGKEGLVRARLAKRLRKLSLPDFDAYLRYVDEDQSRAEFAEMIDALTTNKTNFFREATHFDFLQRHVLPQLSGDVRIWSAGCASGEEAYTLAMIVNEAFPDAATRNISIHATDISNRVLATARSGSYPKELVADIPEPWRARYWTEVRQADGRVAFEAGPELKRLMKFSQLNLMEPWPLHGPVDVIFCRNVMIYFDKDTQQRLVERFWALLRPGGWLFVGHSESLTGLSHRFRYVQPAVYTR